jgi:hypothetical protein
LLFELANSSGSHERANLTADLERSTRSRNGFSELRRRRAICAENVHIASALQFFNAQLSITLAERFQRGGLSRQIVSWGARH